MNEITQLWVYKMWGVDQNFKKSFEACAMSHSPLSLLHDLASWEVSVEHLSLANIMKIMVINIFLNYTYSSLLKIITPKYSYYR